MDEQVLLERLREAFLVETQERLEVIASGLLALERTLDTTRRQDVLESLVREAHTLKGAARAASLPEVESLCQALEGTWKAAGAWSGRVDRAVLDLWHDALTLVEQVLEHLNEPRTPDWRHRHQEVLERLRALSGSEAFRESMGASSSDPGGAAARGPRMETPVSAGSGGAGGAVEKQEDAGSRTAESNHEVAVEKEEEADSFPANGVQTVVQDAKNEEDPRFPAPGPEPLVPSMRRGRGATLRISSERLEALLLRSEEMIALKPVYQQRIRRIGELLAAARECQHDWLQLDGRVKSLAQRVQHGQGRGRQETSCRDELIDLVKRGWERAQVVERGLIALAKTIADEERLFGRMADELLEDARKAALVPVSTLFDRMPRMVRELARSLGKEVDLVLEGQELELDRRVLDALKDALIHLVRNAVDHGIETPEVRQARGKPARGTIRLSARQPDGDKVWFVVADDGRGLDGGELKRRAVALDIVTEEDAEQMEEAGAWDLAFRPELSTRTDVNEISGRGIGLDIVRREVESVGGLVRVTSRAGEGTTFTLELPVSTSTFRGVLVEVAGRRFVVPCALVERVGRVARDKVRTSAGKTSFVLDDRLVPCASLAALLGLSPLGDRSGATPHVQYLVVGSGDARVALEVDVVVGEQEVVVKPLGPQLARVPHIFGATVLGNGEIAPILRVGDLLRHARSTPCGVQTGSASAPGRRQTHRSILVVDDSIISRTLLRNILELAGYSVETAVDGVDALGKLKAHAFAAVVSDVTMPGMDGLELTRAIRRDAALARTPVILVTALEAEEDRVAGLEAGADAYIVKRGFDQEILLDAVRKLV